MSPLLTMRAEDIIRESAAAAPDTVELRRKLHAHPEISKKEFQTALLIEAHLDAAGIPHRRVGETGVLGVIKGGLDGGKTVLLRADTDALPIFDEKDVPYRSQNSGAAHVCGHDAHTAALVAAGQLLAAHREKFGGEVRLMFQQGEEVGYGARVFIENGAMDGVDSVFGWHCAPDLPAGKIGIIPGAVNASVDYFKIKIRGRGAHISTPQLGIDALLIAAKAVCAIKAAAADAAPFPDNVLIGIGKLTAGTVYNSIAENAEIEGTIRAFTQTARENAKHTVEALCSAAAQREGGSVGFEWREFTSPLINDPQICARVSDIAGELFGADCPTADRAPALAGDDFAELLLLAKGAYIYFGTSNSENPDTLSACHNGHFDIDERVLSTAPALMAACALSFLSEEQN